MTTQPQERDILPELQRYVDYHEAEDRRGTTTLLRKAIAEITRLRAQPSPREVAKVLELWSSAAAGLTEITPDTYRWALKQIAQELAALPVSVSPLEVALEKALRQFFNYYPPGINPCLDEAYKQCLELFPPAQKGEPG